MYSYMFETKCLCKYVFDIICIYAYIKASKFV